jgi:cytochrome P450
MAIGSYSQEPAGKVGVDDLPIEQIDVSQHRLFETAEVLPLFARLRREAPIHFCTQSQFGPYWSITRHEDIMRVDTDPGTFSSAVKNGGVSIDDRLMRDPKTAFRFEGFIAKDPPSHGRYRKAVQPIVSAESLQNLRSLIQQRTNRILDELPVGEDFDWVERVSVALTTMMMATMFDVPQEDGAKLAYWSDITGAIEGADGFVSYEHRTEQLMKCLDYFTVLFKERAAAPPKFDLISMLAHDPDTRNLEPMDLLGQVLLLIVGSNDTTRNSMSASINCLNLFPDEFRKLWADPNRIESMVKEVVRWQTPIAHQRRTAMKDIAIRDQTIRAGDKVVMWYYSGNRDETVFPDPDRIRFDRENINRHLSFGFGIHRCMGMRVAELQLRILWQSILERFDGIELVAAPKRMRSISRNGYKEMMVRVKPKSAARAGH